MKIILTENIRKLGKIGEIKEVKDGYARNFLIPGNKAILATSENFKKLEGLKKKREVAVQQELEEMRQIAQKLNGFSLPIKTKTDEKGHLYAAINTPKIKQALLEQGVDVEKEFILVPEPIRKLGTYKILFKYNEEIGSEFNLEVIKA